MKAIVWTVCILGSALIQTALRGNGILLGAIPTMLLISATLWIARTLCNKIDGNNGKKR